MKWALLITWFATGHPPVTSKVEFQSYEKCIKASGLINLEFSKKLAKAELMTICVEQ